MHEAYKGSIRGMIRERACNTSLVFKKNSAPTTKVSCRKLDDGTFEWSNTLGKSFLTLKMSHINN